MKKIICLFIGLIMVLSFAGCKNNKTEETKKPTLETDASGVDIVKYVKAGEMPEASYPVGYDVNKIEQELAEKEDSSFEKNEGETYTTFMVIKEVDDSPENIQYIYETDHPENGIKYIVSFTKSYGFENDMDPNTVSETMASKGQTANLKAIPNDLIQFVPASRDCDCLTYNISGYSLNFIFDSNYLAATILYKKG